MLKINEIDPGAENIRFIARVNIVLFRLSQQLLFQTIEETMSDVS